MTGQIRKSRFLCACSLVPILVLVGLACSKPLPSVKMSSPFGYSNWVKLQDAHVAQGPRPSLGVTITNQKRNPIWVRMVIDELEGRNDCANSFKLLPGLAYEYVCPQASVNAGNRYRAELVVFKDQGNTKPTERLHRIILLKEGAGGNLVLEGRDAE